MANKIRTAVIGVGVGFAHVRGYQESPLADLVALCDANPTVLKVQGEAYNIPEADRYTDYNELLKRDDIDAVSVALPNFLHEPVALAAFQHGKHVLCEKPLSTDPNQRPTHFGCRQSRRQNPHGLLQPSLSPRNFVAERAD